ncbi:MAG: ThuA domain-containing protein [Solirubrobacteraceae bacterium]
MVAAALVTAALARPELLVVTEARGFVHASIPAARRSIAHLGYRTRMLSGADQLTAARLRGAAAVVFLNTSGDLRLDASGRRRLLGWIRAGGAFVGAHAAADTWPAWGAFHDMLGADFRGHGPPAVRRVRIVDPRFTTQRSFSIREEFYAFRGRTPLHVIARRPDGGALVWTRRYGRGRVFYDALGHFAATWRDARQRRLMADGLRWAVG